MKNSKEDTLQIAAVTWFRLSYPNTVIMAVPNGGYRNAIEAAKLKRTGTLAGVADLFVMHAAWNYHGLWIEMKVGKNSQTESQEIFGRKAKEAGYAYKLCRSIDEFILLINEYLSHDKA